MDLHQLWTIVSLPDNVPIVLLLFVVPFYTWYGLKQAFANDRLIEQLEANPEMAKTHHRKVQPWRPEWARDVHVWPFLLRIEFLAAIIVTIILMVWSITLNAPLEEPANPTLTMNPSKAPWYFLGLQEMLVYFDPWMAGVVMPSLIIVGLMVIPYIDTNPLGNGYYTYKQRKFSIWTFIFGFIVLWVSMIVIGTLIRVPGWMWFCRALRGITTASSSKSTATCPISSASTPRSRRSSSAPSWWADTASRPPGSFTS